MYDHLHKGEGVSCLLPWDARRAPVSQLRWTFLGLLPLKRGAWSVPSRPVLRGPGCSVCRASRWWKYTEETSKCYSPLPPTPSRRKPQPVSLPERLERDDAALPEARVLSHVPTGKEGGNVSLDPMNDLGAEHEGSRARRAWGLKPPACSSSESRGLEQEEEVKGLGTDVVYRPTRPGDPLVRSGVCPCSI